MKPFPSFVLLTLVLGFSTACQTLPKVPAPQAVKVDSLNVSVEEFEGRPDAYADVTGYLSSPAAQLIDPPRQSRQGYRLYVEIEEQPALPSAGAATPTPFRVRVAIDIAGLAPGVYLVNINGKEEHLEIDGAGLRPARDRGQLL